MGSIQTYTFKVQTATSPFETPAFTVLNFKQGTAVTGNLRIDKFAPLQTQMKWVSLCILPATLKTYDQPRLHLSTATSIHLVCKIGMLHPPPLKKAKLHHCPLPLTF
jgi:hypothetical protein